MTPVGIPRSQDRDPCMGQKQLNGALCGSYTKRRIRLPISLTNWGVDWWCFCTNVFPAMQSPLIFLCWSNGNKNQYFISLCSAFTAESPSLPLQPPIFISIELFNSCLTVALRGWELAHKSRGTLHWTEKGVQLDTPGCVGLMYKFKNMRQDSSYLILKLSSYLSLFSPIAPWHYFWAGIQKVQLVSPIICAIYSMVQKS